MKHFYLLVTLLFAVVLGANAQVRANIGRTVTGTVTDKVTGESLVGVTVSIIGTTIGGTVTDIDGKYSLTIATKMESPSLRFSYVGYKNETVAVGSSNVVDVQLSEDALELDQVVVTALGISREQKALSYATQQVNTETMAKNRTDNFVNNLQGKVAGVQIFTGSNMGGSSRILIRGINSISGENQPLFVIDGIPMDNSNFNTSGQTQGGGGYDYGNAIGDLNPDDIESVNILKGANATALYGSRASNGAVIVTTKRGTKRKGIGVSVNSGIALEQISLFPDYQKSYGGGIANPDDPSGFYPIEELNGQLTPDYGTDESWGPKFENQQVRAWNSFDAFDVANYNKLTSWKAAENDVPSFFELGRTFNNNISIAGGNDLGTFRLSYTNVNTKGVFPNSELQRNTVGFNGDLNVTKKFTVGIGANYVRTNALGRYETGYNDGITSNFNQWWQRQVDFKDLETYKNPDGSQRSWNRVSWDDGTPNYWNNPYWTRYENYNTDAKDHYFGNIKASYKITDWLTVQGRVLQDFYNLRLSERIAIGSVQIPEYHERFIDVTERNMDLIFMVNRQLTDDLSLTANLGGNRMKKVRQDNSSTTVGGLVVPNWYNIRNSVGSPVNTDQTFDKRINSIFGSASLGFRNMLYLDVTGRNDWSSTLPKNNNSYFYPSVGVGFVFTELPSLKDMNRVLSFGKLRGSWAKVANDTDPYQVYDIYGFVNNFQGTPMYTLPNTKNNDALKPEISTAYEAGLDMKFFQNRLGFDVTYYNKKASNQIVNVTTDPTSGFAGAVLNAGDITNYGWEVQLHTTPVKTTSGFRWDVDFNWAKNNNSVDTLYGISTLRLGSIFGGSINVITGQPYGSILGTAFARNEDGKIIVDADGLPTFTTAQTNLGSTLADWTAGISTTITYKGLTIGGLIDIQKGGKIYSLTNMFGSYSGLFENTVFDENGNDIRANGYVFPDAVKEVLDAEGNVTGYAANDIAANAQSFFENGYSITEQHVYDASFVKLREARIGYTFPNNLFGNTGLRDLTLSLVGRNLAILHKNIPNIDPESSVSSRNVQGLEGGAILPTRTIGLNLSFNF